MRHSLHQPPVSVFDSMREATSMRTLLQSMCKGSNQTETLEASGLSEESERRWRLRMVRATSSSWATAMR